MFRKVVLASAIALATSQVQAAPLFDVKFTWGNQEHRVSGNKAEDILDQVNADNFEDFFVGYSRDEAGLVNAELTYRGVKIEVDYEVDDNGDEVVRLKSDALKLDKTFTNL